VKHVAANAAVVYFAGNFDTATQRLMGRHAASEGFLKGFSRYSGVDKFYCYTRSREEHEKFRAMIQGFLGREPSTAWIPFMNLREIMRPGCLYRPGPNVGHFAWERRRLSNRAYSLCGVTHTTAEHQIMDAIGDLLVAPVQRWDAVICTSEAVKSMVERVLKAYGEYLEQRFGNPAEPVLQLPVIPLGTDCDIFLSGEKAAAARQRMRAEHGIAEKDIVVLFVGRLNAFEKANPLQMYACVEAAAQRTGLRFHLIQAGWFAGEFNEQAIREGANNLAPSVRHLFLDGRDPAIRREVWTCADIFASLSDNIQETFGLTPVEAMAAGLPAVVSDWNGYRDTIRDGIEGFRIPTVMPPAGQGEDIAYRYAAAVDGYATYCGRSSQFISVDAKRCTDAFVELARRPELRRAMSAAGRRRARELYDWKVVIPQYQALWAELAARRQRDEEIVPNRPGRPPQPLREDPFSLFRAYPTAVIEERSVVSLIDGYGADGLKRISTSRLARIGGRSGDDDSDVAQIVSHLETMGPTSVTELRSLLPHARRWSIQRTLGWMGKLSIVRIIRPQTDSRAAAEQKQAREVATAD